MMASTCWSARWLTAAADARAEGDSRVLAKDHDIDTAPTPGRRHAHADDRRENHQPDDIGLAQLVIIPPNGSFCQTGFHHEKGSLVCDRGEVQEW